MLKTLMRLLLLIFIVFPGFLFAQSIDDVYPKNPDNNLKGFIHLLFATKDEIATVDQLPAKVGRFISNEQYLNDKVNHRSFEDISSPDFISIFAPETHITFKIWTVYIPIEDLDIYTMFQQELPSRFVVEKAGKKYFRFLVHPVSYFYYQHFFKGRYEWKAEFLALATSSIRSLIIWEKDRPKEPLYVKLSLFANVGGFTRILTKENIIKSVAFSEVMSLIPEKIKEDLQFDFISERVAVMPKGVDAGMIIRDMDQTQKYEIVPYFSFYSHQLPELRNDPTYQRTFFEFVFRNTSPSDIKGEVIRHFIKPLVKLANYFYFELGLTSQLHEQNILKAMMKTKNGTKEINLIRDSEQFYPDTTALFELSSYYNYGLKYPVDNLLKVQAQTPGDGPIEQMTTYIRDSNLYALQKGIEYKYPQITRRWINNEFRKAMSAEFESYTGIKANSLNKMEAALASLIKKEDESQSHVMNQYNQLFKQSPLVCAHLF